jgi:hypothetical protein
MVPGGTRSALWAAALLLLVSSAAGDLAPEAPSVLELASTTWKTQLEALGERWVLMEFYAHWQAARRRSRRRRGGSVARLQSRRASARYPASPLVRLTQVPSLQALPARV